MKKRPKSIKEFIIKALKQHPSDIVAVTAKHFNVTRTTVHRHLNTLLKAHRIVKSGTTRNVKYYLPTEWNRELSYQMTATLNEFDVLSKDFSDIFEQLPKNIADICEYGFTEIFNNAIDHSRGTKVTVATAWQQNRLTIVIADDGIGIFKNIADYFQLDDIRESILQLNKGKMTTDPANHSGEGIFFCARLFDCFEIYANGLHYIRDNREKDWSIECLTQTNKGSKVCMNIDVKNPVEPQLTDLFKAYQSPETLAFERTEIVVELSRLGHETLISRSQAKRITRGLEKFTDIILDFSGVRLIGQGFVDQIFRVFASKHPKIHITYINANDDVTFMIKRGLASR